MHVALREALNDAAFKIRWKAAGIMLPFEEREAMRVNRFRGAAQAHGPRADSARGAIEACRLEARGPVGVASGAVAMRYEPKR